MENKKMYCNCTAQKYYSQVATTKSLDGFRKMDVVCQKRNDIKIRVVNEKTKTSKQAGKNISNQRKTLRKLPKWYEIREIPLIKFCQPV